MYLYVKHHKLDCSSKYRRSIIGVVIERHHLLDGARAGVQLLIWKTRELRYDTAVSYIRIAVV